MEWTPLIGCSGNPIMPNVTRTGPWKWRNVPLASLIQFRENVQTKPTQVSVVFWSLYDTKLCWLHHIATKLKSFLNYIIYIIFSSLGNIDEICKQNPKAILRKNDNCAQYYNCSVSNSSYGGHLQECKYPDLFSTVSMGCENFKTVTCDNRTEPQAPCEFWMLRRQVFKLFK